MINRRTFISSAAAAVALAARAGAGHRRPNFVFFLADDLGWADAGCYGSSFHDTPAIDRLAAEGMRFTDAYAAAPVCSPTRASIMTGKYPARLNATNYFTGRKQGRLIPPDYQDWVDLSEVTIAEALKDAGYQTFIVGKWHLGREKYYPEHQGFDVNIGGSHAGAPGFGYFSPYNLPRIDNGPAGEYLTDRLTDEACRLIDRAGQNPFLLYLSHYAVHVPLQAKADYVAKYRERAEERKTSRPRFGREGFTRSRLVQDHPTYAGMIQSLDDSLGRVLDKLKAAGIEQDTVVIFMSDNGGLSTAEGWPTSNLPLRAGKGWLYEGGIREPMIVRWPGLTRPGSVCDTPVTSADFFPTMLEMAGLAARPEQAMDGVSFAPLLRGEAFAERPLFWHYPHYSNQGGKPSGAVRLGDFKLIEYFEEMNVELFNLREDVGERRNLSQTLPAKTVELRDLLHEWRRSVDAKMPTPNPRHPENYFR